jgi:hypothetical protein
MIYIVAWFDRVHTFMKLIQARVTDVAYKAFQHWLVEEDMGVSEAIGAWIYERCKVPTMAKEEKLRRIEEEMSRVQVKLEEQVKLVKGNTCKICGVPVKGAVMLCDECSKPQ